MIKHTEMNIKYKYNIYLHIHFPPDHHDVIKNNKKEEHKDSNSQ